MAEESLNCENGPGAPDMSHQRNQPETDSRSRTPEPKDSVGSRTIAPARERRVREKIDRMLEDLRLEQIETEKYVRDLASRRGLFGFTTSTG